jgi:hypothetical protein
MNQSLLVKALPLIRLNAEFEECSWCGFCFKSNFFFPNKEIIVGLRSWSTYHPL